LVALTSNAVAQTVEGAATDLPKTTGEATLSNTPDSLAESEQTSQNQAVSTWVAEPETTLTSETVKPEFALSPDIVSAPQPENNPTSDTAQPEFAPIPATVLAPKSEIMSTPERVEPEFALSPTTTFAPDSKTVEDVTPSPDVESEASLLDIVYTTLKLTVFSVVILPSTIAVLATAALIKLV
jgi:hypothetical protein